MNPVFNDPKELVAWMGALQGQEYSMAKWAVVTVEETGHPEGGGGFGEGRDIADSRVTPDLASGGGGGYSMDVEVVGQTGEVGVRFVLEKSWNIGRVAYQES